ncbi:hypothetical protein FOZ61_005541 [Perkinsus olseni]|uniref:Uncharacterized protein n=1 Tax=Perkinsus olseni TaxID=32597 RepID=A0A7J6LH01_PEROL|nr:hypothetical protein FOZ61_005541 [Perkinsus olseni]
MSRDGDTRAIIASHPVDPRVLNALDSITLGNGHEPTECSICVQRIGRDDKCLELPTCGHIYHWDCIMNWLKIRGHCPVCRAVVDESFAIAAESAAAAAASSPGHDTEPLPKPLVHSYITQEDLNKFLNGQSIAYMSRYAHDKLQYANYDRTVENHYETQLRDWKCTFDVDHPDSDAESKGLYQSIHDIFGRVTHESKSAQDHGIAKDMTEPVQISWLLGLVQDLHQPLHTGFGADDHGRRITVQYHDDPSTNLYDFWERDVSSAVNLETQLVLRAYNDELDKLVQEGGYGIKLVQKIYEKGIAEWIAESMEMACSDIYSVIAGGRGREVPRMYQIDDEVYARWRDLATKQVVKGAARSAVVLHAIAIHARYYHPEIVGALARSNKVQRHRVRGNWMQALAKNTIIAAVVVHSRSRRLQSSIHDASSIEDLMRRSREYSLVGATQGGLPPAEPHQILGISPSSFVNSETSLDEWYQLLELQIRKVNIFFELQYEDLESQVVETEKLVHSIASSSSSSGSGSSIGIATQYHQHQSPVYAQEHHHQRHETDDLNGRQIEYPYNPSEGNLQAPLIREKRHRSPEETHNTQMMMRAENAIANLTERIDLLRSYSRLNHLAVAKILKKHDKVTRIGLSQVLMPEVSSQPFYDLGRLDALDKRLQRLVPCTNPSEGDQQFLKRLRYFREHMGGGHSKLLRGFYVGVSVMLMIDLIVLICIPHTNPNFDEAAFFASLTAFRFVFMCSLALWSAGWAMNVLETYSVNYLFLLDCDPNIEVRSDTLFNIAAVHTSLFILFFGLYVVDYKFAIFGYHGYYVVYPAILLFFWLVSMFWPHDVFRLRYRKGIAMSLWRTVKAPFGGSVTFADNITGDVLTSAVKPLQDLVLAFFFFSAPLDIARTKTENHPFLIPLIAFLPYWFRMMQCLNRWWETRETRHLWNFGKYTCGNIMVVVTAIPLSDFPYFSVYTERLIWVFVYCLSSMYMYCWDVGMDWGIVSFSTTDHTGTFLSREHMLPRWMYGAAAFTNLIGRTTWALTLMPAHTVLKSPVGSQVLRTVVAGMEIMRRAQWFIIRCEFEHLTNASKYRSLLWVPPLISKEDLHATRKRMKPLFTVNVKSIAVDPSWGIKDTAVAAMNSVRSRGESFAP